MELVHVTRADEGIGLDGARLAALWQDLGPEMARKVLDRARTEISARLSEIAQAEASADMTSVLRAARRLGRVAEHVGMSRIARVSGDVAQCAVQRDPVALSATAARLFRLCERALGRDGAQGYPGWVPLL
ncbi:hypothetical protein ACFQXB_01130 [Plastorhodobacter daqingensis]|uniref:HPt domain-containing protein n=1 Tax=Plastorhodobacter daqingensis TaxID=1387281 RepID=A0ABW2UF59_9RHOB